MLKCPCAWEKKCSVNCVFFVSDEGFFVKPEEINKFVVVVKDNLKPKTVKSLFKSQIVLVKMMWVYLMEPKRVEMS